MEGLGEGRGARTARAVPFSVILHSLDAEGNLVLTLSRAMEGMADSGNLPPKTREIEDIEINNDMALVK